MFDRAGVVPPPPEAPEAWRSMLPAPWPDRVEVTAQGSFADSTGRTVLERLRVALPRIAARELRRTRSLEGVPAGARGVLAAHWRSTNTG